MDPNPEQLSPNRQPIYYEFYHKKCPIIDRFGADELNKTRDSVRTERYLTEQKIPLGSIQILQGGKREMLRSIKKAFDIIKADDPESAVTVHTIRTWCKEGKIKCLTTGNKVLVDIQSLLDYIAMKN